MKKELYFEKDKTTQLTLEECLIKCKSLTTGKLIQKWSNVYERDDLIQMANIGIINAYNSYDVKYKSPFIQYAEYFIRREINNEYTKDNRDKRKANTARTKALRRALKKQFLYFLSRGEWQFPQSLRSLCKEGTRDISPF